MGRGAGKQSTPDSFQLRGELNTARALHSAPPTRGQRAREGAYWQFAATSATAAATAGRQQSRLDRAAIGNFDYWNSRGDSWTG